MIKKIEIQLRGQWDEDTDAWKRGDQNDLNLKERSCGYACILSG
jgi:hypothetical protein